MMDIKSKNKYIRGMAFYTAMVGLCFVRALATYVFVVPNAFAPGGISGIASIIYNAVLPSNPQLAQTLLNPALTIFAMNVPLLVLSFLKVNRAFTKNTTICVLLYSGFMGLFSLVGFPQFVAPDLSSSIMILAALAGGVLSGLSLGPMLLLNMSAGGTEIIGKVIYSKNTLINVQWLIFIFDGIVVLLSGIIGLLGSQPGETSSIIFVRVMTPILFSFITLFTSSKVADIINNGFESSVVFNIITDKADELAKAIVENINRGATILSGVGSFTHSERKVVICVVRKNQLVTLRRLMLSIDPQAFSYITNAREVNGQGFRSSSG